MLAIPPLPRELPIVFSSHKEPVGEYEANQREWNALQIEREANLKQIS